MQTMKNLEGKVVLSSAGENRYRPGSCWETR